MFINGASCDMREVPFYVVDALGAKFNDKQLLKRESAACLLEKT